jgi:hypothetical protein
MNEDEPDPLVGCLRPDWDKGIQGLLEQASSFRSGTLVMSGMGVRTCVLEALKAHGITIAPNAPAEARGTRRLGPDVGQEASQCQE